MKKYLGAALTALFIWGCADTKKQEKSLLDSVIAVHDKVMANDEHLMKNKMVLDSLLKLQTVAGNKWAGAELLTKINNADSAMSDWMHKFDVENKGKSHQQIIDYLGDQKTKIIAIDSQINVAISQSDKYLNQIKK
jgi:hypothetical protein